jgi:hypothetical protein
MNANQHRHVMTTLGYIDQVLGDAWRNLSPRIEDARLFPRYRRTVDDATERELRDGLARLRKSMRDCMNEYGWRPSSPHASDLRQFQSALIAADVAVRDMEPDAMVGYGTLEPHERDELQRFCAILRNHVRSMLESVAKAETASTSAISSRSQP